MTVYSPQIIGPLWGASEFCLMLFKRSKSGAVSKDRHSLGIIWLVTLAAVALGIVAAYQLRFGRLPASRLVTAISCGMFIFGMALRWYAILHLGRFFTVNVAIHSDHQVVDSGPYRFIRHPSYTGSLLTVAGFSMTLNNWASFVIIVLPCVAVTLWRVRIEEQALRAALGESYTAYMRRTRRLIPFIY
jgi:protein-S-isoprenylcysteine O-methyltransferase